jgi:hypothetical protein
MASTKSLRLVGVPPISTFKNEPMAQALAAAINVDATDADDLQVEAQNNSDYDAPKNTPPREWVRVWLTQERAFSVIDLSYDDARKLRDFLTAVIGD